MAEQVERFDFSLGTNGSQHKHIDGNWVRYADYQKLETEYDEATQQLATELADERSRVQHLEGQLDG